MRLLYIALKYDYGDPRRGLSFEHWNLYHALSHMGHDIVYFDLGTQLERRGKGAMNRRLAEVASAERPDLAFFVLFKDEIDPQALASVRAACPTVNWFCDDHWRFESFSRHYAPHFDRVVTTAVSALPKYAALGVTGVIKSQWGCNHFLYRRLDDAQPLHDVTFVGQPHGDRRETIEWLRGHGIAVRTWGHGWPAGRLSQEGMIRVFNESRINLNLANASPLVSLRGLTRAAVASAFQRYHLPRGAARPDSSPLRLALSSLGARLTRRYPTEQIKGRTFEIPGCAGFQLTTPAENLDRYYLPESEIAHFRGRRALLQRVKHFLEHDDERRRIAAAAHRRTLAEHTYVHRFREIFAGLGPEPPPLDAMLTGDCNRGETLEVS